MKTFLPIAVLLCCFHFASAQNEWHPVSTATDPIQSLQVVKDTLYGHVVNQGVWQIRKFEDGFWKVMKPLNLGSDQAIMIERFQGKTYALTSKRLLRFNGSAWVTVLTSDFSLMCAYRNRIILRGDFISFQGSLALGLAYYDGSTGGVLKMPNNQIASITGGVGQMSVYNDKLYFSGNMSNTQLGTAPCKMLVWNDSTWTNPFLPIPGYPNVSQMLYYNGDIYFNADKTYKIVGQIAEPMDSLDASVAFYPGLKFGGANNLAPFNGRIYGIADLPKNIIDQNGDTILIAQPTLMFYDGAMWRMQSELAYFDYGTTFNLYANGPGAYSNSKLIGALNALFGFQVSKTDLRASIHMLDTNTASALISVADLRNNPCVLDSAERLIPAMINVNNGADYYYTSAAGPIHVRLPLGQANTLRLKNSAVPYYQPAACSDSTLTLNSTSTSALPANFYQSPSGQAFDVAVHLVGQTGWRARHGFYEDFYLIIKNVGNQHINQSTVLFNYPTQSTFFSSSQAPLTNVGGASSYLVTNIAPGTQKTIVVKLLNTTALINGSLINFSVLAGIPQTDANPLNNQFNLPQTVVGAYDPNNKLVNRERVAQWGGALQYQINFQNLGTDTAYRVVVVDTLPAEVFPGTFQLLGSSHNVEVQLHNRLVHFIFDNIKLPDSTAGGDASKGFVQFAINMSGQLGSTDTIKNRAHIYFDFQPAVITNHARTYYHFPFGEEELALTNFTVYPNPSTGTLFISTKVGGDFTMSNGLGQVVWQGNLGAELSAQIDLGHLASGMYYLSDGNGNVQKIVFLKE